jgi:hypothetical protein
MKLRRYSGLASGVLGPNMPDWTSPKVFHSSLIGVTVSAYLACFRSAINRVPRNLRLCVLYSGVCKIHVDKIYGFKAIRRRAELMPTTLSMQTHNAPPYGAVTTCATSAPIAYPDQPRRLHCKSVSKCFACPSPPPYPPNHPPPKIKHTSNMAKANELAHHS